MRKNGLTAAVAAAVSLACTGVVAAFVVATPAAGAAGAAARPAPPAAVANGTADEPAGLADAKASDCFACHAIDHKVVGPAYDAVAKRYAGQGGAAVDKLVEKVIKGGAGDWGSIAMTPHPDLGEAKTRTIVEWILALQPAAGTATAGVASGKRYTYETSDGKRVTLDFPVFVPGQRKQVTDAIFTGYEQFNSTCNRCHGDDAVGGAYAAPDLRRSLVGGMSWQQFLSTVMAGREAQGMPSWAGFYTPEQVRDIYEYVKGRSVDLVPEGRPPSKQD